MVRNVLIAATFLVTTAGLAWAHSGNGASGSISAGPGDYASSSGHTAVNNAPGTPNSKAHSSQDFDEDKLPDQNPNKR